MTRIVRIPAKDRLDLLVQHVRGACRLGETVLILTANQPASVLLRRLDAAGVDPRMVFIVDTLGDGPGIRAHDERTHIVAAPSMLELIGLRVKRILRSHPGRVRIIVNDCDSFALYNPASTLSEYLRYVLHRMSRKLDIDFVLQEPTALDGDLVDLLRASAAQTLLLAPETVNA